MVKTKSSSNLNRSQPHLIVFFVTLIVLYCVPSLLGAHLSGLIQSEVVCRTPGFPFKCSQVEISGNEMIFDIYTMSDSIYHIVNLDYIKNPHSCRPTPETEHQLESGLTLGHYQTVMGQKATALTFTCESNDISILDLELTYYLEGDSKPRHQWIYTSKRLPQLIVPWIVLLLLFGVAGAAAYMVVMKKSIVPFVGGLILLFVISHVLTPWSYYSYTQSSFRPADLGGTWYRSISIIFCLLTGIAILLFRSKRKVLWLLSLAIYALVSLFEGLTLT